ncbi:MAG: type II toxin-antitoxin system PemK/MazF family toxin [Draconibacterium sp.]
MYKNSIVLVPFPFDDFSGTKVRPAICLTSGIGVYGHIIIAFISSRINQPGEKFDIRIKKEDALFPGTGLRTDSVIKLHRMTTIPAHLIHRKLGEANKILTERIDTNLLKLFELK